MALQNTSTQEYCKIVGIDTSRNTIYIQTFKNKKTRDDGLGKYDRTEDQIIFVGTLDEELAKLNGKESVKNELLTAGYACIKKEPPYKNGEWEDA